MKSVEPQVQAPPDIGTSGRKGFSYTEIKIFEMIANLCIASALMVILVGMTLLIGWLRRDHASVPGPEQSPPPKSSPQQSRP